MVGASGREYMAAQAARRRRATGDWLPARLLETAVDVRQVRLVLLLAPAVGASVLQQT